MKVVQLQKLFDGSREIGVRSVIAVSIGSGSVLDLVEVDSQPLGVGGVLPASPMSRVSARARSKLSDAMNMQPTPRLVDAAGVPYVAQVSDSCQMLVWEVGDQIAPPPRRANYQLTRYIAGQDITATTLALGGATPIMRAGATGRKTAHIWIAPQVLSGAASSLSLLVYLKRYQEVASSAVAEGTFALVSQSYAITFANDALGAFPRMIVDGAATSRPITIELAGAHELEIVAAGAVGMGSVNPVLFSLELVDP